jgi:peptidoglycan/LPS O-acetylase OafA/YrhL
MKQFIRQILRDKDDNYSLRELVIIILLVALITAWIGQQFFGKHIPDAMFYTFASLVAAGVFGYSLEKRSPGAGGPTWL